MYIRNFKEEECIVIHYEWIMCCALGNYHDCRHALSSCLNNWTKYLSVICCLLHKLRLNITPKIIWSVWSNLQDQMCTLPRQFVLTNRPWARFWIQTLWILLHLSNQYRFSALLNKALVIIALIINWYIGIHICHEALIHQTKSY